MTTLLRVEGLVLRFGQARLLDGASLHIDAGETVALLGDSGAGKSALALSLIGLPPPAALIEAGQVRFSGQDMLAMPERDRARLRGAGGMAMVFQHPRRSLNPVRRVGGQLADVLLAHQAIPRRAARSSAAAALAALGLAPDVLDAYPSALSGGMCQRVMIALALAARPALLIADEPTTGLDPAARDTALDLIAAQARFRGMACLLITHDHGLAHARADRVLALRGGRIGAAGRPSPRLAATAQAHPVTAPLLEVRGLTRAFGSAIAVDSASFTVGQGEAVGLVGPSGCGKSTLAALVARLIEPDSGAIRLRGHDLAAIPAHRTARAPWRRLVQMVQQDPGDSLDPLRTAWQSVLSPLARLTALAMSDQRAQARAALDRAGVPRALHDRRPPQLSGGERARVCLARAIAPDPALLILDEPTAALDPVLRAHLLDLLDQLRRERGMACLLISHDADAVARVCGRVLAMEGGRIA